MHVTMYVTMYVYQKLTYESFFVYYDDIDWWMDW
jgi:hypothetical protein